MGLLSNLPMYLPGKVEATLDGYVAAATAGPGGFEDIASALERVTVGALLLRKATEIAPKGAPPNPDSVDFIHVNGLRRVFGQYLRVTTDTTKPTLQMWCPNGVATAASEPDGPLAVRNKHGQDVALGGNVEAKASDSSPLEALGQAAATGSNAVVRLKEMGLAIEDCFIVSMVTNGALVQFGVSSLLDDCFPLFTVTTKVLDLLDADDRLLAARWCYMMRAHCAALESCEVVQNSAQPSTASLVGPALTLSEDQYHLKKLDDVFPIHGRVPLSSFHSSIMHIFRIFKRLRRMGIQEAVTALGMRTGDRRLADAMIFPKLCGWVSVFL